MSDDVWKHHHSTSECFFHIQLTIKYRRSVVTPEVEDTIREICTGFKDRYHLRIIKLGFDQDHMHFLLQALPKYSGGKIVRLVKSIIARQVFERHEEVKQKLWDGEFWTDGYYISTVSPYGRKTAIEDYIEQHDERNTDQLRLFNL